MLLFITFAFILALVICKAEYPYDLSTATSSQLSDDEYNVIREIIDRFSNNEILDKAETLAKKLSYTYENSNILNNIGNSIQKILTDNKDRKLNARDVIVASLFLEFFSQHYYVAEIGENNSIFTSTSHSLVTFCDMYTSKNCFFSKSEIKNFKLRIEKLVRLFQLDGGYTGVGFLGTVGYYSAVKNNYSIAAMPVRNIDNDYVKEFNTMDDVKAFFLKRISMVDINFIITEDRSNKNLISMKIPVSWALAGMEPKDLMKNISILYSDYFVLEADNKTAISYRLRVANGKYEKVKSTEDEWAFAQSYTDIAGNSDDNLYIKTLNSKFSESVDSPSWKNFTNLSRTHPFRNVRTYYLFIADTKTNTLVAAAQYCDDITDSSKKPSACADLAPPFADLWYIFFISLILVGVVIAFWVLGAKYNKAYNRVRAQLTEQEEASDKVEAKLLAESEEIENNLEE